MKYKVGDKVRMSGGDVITIERFVDTYAYHNMFVCVENNLMYFNSGISHLVISEITDELIDRFKNEKIAWHFKNREDYRKVLNILEDKGMEFNRYFNHPELLFTTEMKDFNIRYVPEGLTYDNYLYLKEIGYEIIEIMNPVYVPSITRFIFDNFIAPPQYKGYDCEVLFQQYMQQKKIPDLEKKVENQKVEIKNLHNKINEFQNVLTFEMSYSKTLAKENDELKKQIEILLDDVNFYKGRISVAREILDYED